MRKSILRTTAAHARRARGWIAISGSTTPSDRIRRSTIVALPICITDKGGAGHQPIFSAWAGHSGPAGPLCPAHALSPRVKRFNRVTGAPTRKTGSKVVLDIGSTLSIHANKELEDYRKSK